MLFDSSIRKELARSFGATLVVLITVVMTMMLIRTLGLASKGNINPSDVMLVMGFTVLGYLPTILTLSLFVAVVGTLSRMYRDSEMVIWFASGQGLVTLLRPVLRFSWLIVAVVAVLALLVWPWSNQQILELRNQFEQRSDVDRIAPGEFQESADGSRVIFIDKADESESAVSNIFVVESRQGKELVTSAASAHIQVIADVRHAVLEHGQRVENDHDSQTLKITHFEEYSVQLNEGQMTQAELTTKATDTRQLLAMPQPYNLAELGWRLSQPLLAINLVLLALAITSVNPRVGQSSSLAIALLAFVIYYNLLNVGQNWVAVGRYSLPTFLLGLHGSMFVTGALGLAMRHYRWNIRHLWQHRGNLA